MARGVMFFIAAALLAGLWYFLGAASPFNQQKNLATREQEMKKNLMGGWLGQSLSGEEMTLVFRPDGGFRVKKGEKFMTGGFTADYNRKPLHLDLLFQREPANETIAELVDKDTLLFEVKESSSPRPASFGKGKRVLRRNGAEPLSYSRLKELMASEETSSE